MGKPEMLEKILPVKSCQVPFKAMDINSSTVPRNADILADLFQQMGISNLSEQGQSHVKDIGDTVVLIHGDLRTGEQIESL